MRELVRRRGLSFPVLALLLVCFFTALGWSGTSSGALRRAVTGSAADDHVVAGQPREVRSDEWLVATPLTISQAERGLPRVNPTLGAGNDVSLPFAVPYADWSTAFRVETLPYLFLPLTNAFAAAWWLMAWILAVGAYRLVLALLPGRILIASALGAALLLSPFVQWWYIPATLMSLGWACWAGAGYIAISRASSPSHRWAFTAALAYATASLALVSYVPFTIPCTLVAFAVCVGWTFRADPAVMSGQRWREVAFGTVAIVMAAAVVVAFLLSRRRLVTALAATSYPGHRRVSTGGGQLDRLLGGFLDRGLLVNKPSLGAYAPNASEASSFLVFGLFLLLPAGWLIVRSLQQKRRPDGMLPCLGALVVVFLVDLTVPGLNLLAAASGLNLVPHNRLIIGFGLLCFVLVAAVLREADRQQVAWPRWLIIVTGALAVAVTGWIGFVMSRAAPDFAGPTVHYLGWSLVFGAICAALLWRPTLGAAGALLIGIMASVAVNPLYRGVYDIRLTSLGQTIRRVDRSDSGGWVSLAGLATTGILTEAGVQHWSGVYGVPDAALWSWIDPQDRYREIWNRYAYVLFTDDASNTPVQLVQDDVVVVNVDPCSPSMRLHIHHILSDRPLHAECLHTAASLNEGLRHFVIYDVTPTPAD